MGLRRQVSRDGYKLKLSLMDDPTFLTIIQVGEKTYEATNVGDVFYFNGLGYFGPHEN